MILTHPRTPLVFGTVMIGLLAVYLTLRHPSPGSLAAAHAHAIEGTSLATCTTCHAGAGLAQGCLKCHVEIAGQIEAERGYHAFLLRGKEITCAGCHPDHLGVTFSLVSALAWGRRDPNLFDHPHVQFALSGAHQGLACDACHPDPHTASLGLDCRRCHEQTSWRPTGLIVEHARTRFPLFGAHVAAPCESCHPGAPASQFRGAPTACDLCHRADVARATSPNHAASGWTTNCDRCHTPVTWERAQVVHDFFPLVGGHAGLTCTQCHTSGAFGPIPSNCSACHTADYQRAPESCGAGFSAQL